VYSPFGKNFVKTMIAAALTRRTLSVVDDQVGSPSSALDLADGLLAMLNSWNREPDRGLGQTLHLAGAPPISWCAFARAVMAECRTQGLPSVPIEPILTEQWSTRAARPAMSALNSGKFVETFGFRMPPLERSLAAVIGRVSRTVE
jgi:dTDP-4-dehydrorhamnose reductase